MYAIVRAGGRQEKVSVGDVLIIDKVNGEAGDSIDLTPLLLVDGSTVTSDAGKLTNYAGLIFDEDKSGYLAGALAALVSKAGNVGAVLATDTVPPVWRFGEGFKAGAKYINRTSRSRRCTTAMSTWARRSTTRPGARRPPSR